MLIKSAKQRKTEKVYKSYEHISQDYDAMNDITSLGMHRVWKLKVAEEIKRKKFSRILDLCCGTGDMALLLASGNPGASVTAADFSGEMLRVAQRRKNKKDLTNIEFVKCNAEKLPFHNGAFDCVVISFGLKSVADCEQVMREMYRLVRPGGFVYCLETYAPQEAKVKTAYDAYRNLVVPVVGGALAGKGAEYRRIASVGGKFLSKKEVVRLMQKTGFSKVGYLNQLGGIAACHRGQKPENESSAEEKSVLYVKK